MARRDNDLLGSASKRAERLSNTAGREVSRGTYNIVLGLTVLIGLLINAGIAYFFGETIATWNIWAVIIGCLAASIACIFVIYKSDDPTISFLGFTGLSVAMGILLSDVFIMYDLGTIFAAFVVTAAVVAIMMLISGIFPSFFLGLGKVLFVALLAAIIGELVCVFVAGVDPSIFDWIFVGIFSLYVGYDWQRSQQFPPTLNNAIDSAADIYLDVINLLIRILEIMGRSKR